MGDAEQLAVLGHYFKNITENSSKSHACFLDCIPLGSTIYPKNNSSCALHWQKTRSYKSANTLPL